MAREGIDNLFKYGGEIEQLAVQEKLLSQSKAAWGEYANKICEEVGMLRIISQHDPALFKEMNKSFHNMFTEVVKRDDMHKEYLNTMSNKAVSVDERVQATYEQYKGMKQEYLEARAGIDRIFQRGGDIEDLQPQEKATAAAKEALDVYSKEVCKDRDFMNYLSDNDKTAFKEMNNRLNELVRGMAKDLQKEFDRFF